MIVGEFSFAVYEQAFCNAFRSKNHKVFNFSWSNYFKNKQYLTPELTLNYLNSLYSRLQHKFRFGPILQKINQDLLIKINEVKPELVFIYRGTHIYPKTIKKIKEQGIVVFGYNNDDPFGKKYPKYFWRNFLNGIIYYDHIFVYREKNIQDYKRLDYTDVSILRSYYIKENNYPIENISLRKYLYDVMFAGHYEDDGRDEYVRYLLENGIKVKLFGGDGWKKSAHYNYFFEQQGEIKLLSSEDYNSVVNSAKICLVFLSQLNSDTYTRRCFEIPATQSFMLSEYSEYLNSIFKEGVEAVYFKTKEDLLNQVNKYLSNSEERKRIAINGYNKVMKEDCEVVDRIDKIVEIFNNHKKHEKNINN